jgi:hypothetical protein
MNRELIASEFLKVAQLLVGYGRGSLPRQFHIPKDAQQIKDVDGTDLEIWIYEGEGRNGKYYGGIAFAGKANKPLWHYTFKDEIKRQSYIKDTIDSRKRVLENKKVRMDERRNFKHTLKVDDILYDSWGYDQTNVSWFQVVDVGEKSVKIREIAGKSVSSDHVVPAIGHFTGPAKTKLVGQGNSVRVETGSASQWDGKPKYETPFGAGH